MEKVDCKSYAMEILNEVKAYGQEHKLGRLYIFTAGNDPASKSYMAGKMKDAAYCGVPAEKVECTTQAEMMEKICSVRSQYCLGSNVAGIIVQLPLPDGWDTENILNLIPAELDVDGFGEKSLFQKCTPAGIMHIIRKEYGPNLNGAKVLLIGKGKLVGGPLINMLLEEGVTLTVANSKTVHLEDHYINDSWDVIICATGVCGLINPAFFWGFPLVIDAGIGKKDGKLCGNVDWSRSGHVIKSGKYTPVPGGVGLMTRAMLMRNVMLSSKRDVLLEGFGRD